MAASKRMQAASRSSKLQEQILPFSFQGECGPADTLISAQGSFWLPEVCGIHFCCFKSPCLQFVTATVGNEYAALCVHGPSSVLAAHLPTEPGSLTWCLFKRRTRHLSFFKPAGRQSTHLASSSLFLSTWHLRSPPTQYSLHPRLFSVSPHPGSRFPAKSLASGKIVS